MEDNQVNVACEYPQYAKTMEECKDIENRFTYHAPKADQLPRYTILRRDAKALAEMITSLCPKSREQSLAITKLEEAVMWANASIARHE